MTAVWEESLGTHDLDGDANNLLTDLTLQGSNVNEALTTTHSKAQQLVYDIPLVPCSSGKSLHLE